MNIEITEDRARWRSTDYTWNVRIDGVLIAVAKTPGAGDYVANEVIARNDVAMLKQAISALDAVDQLLTAELSRPVAYCAAYGCIELRTHRDTGFCCAHDAEATGSQCNCAAMRMPEGDYLDADGMRVPAPEDPCCPCGRPALFFVQYPGKTYAYCPDCYRELNAGRPPLLAQCAAIIRRCLGSTTGAGSIIDELRRVDRALSSEGW